MKDFLKIKIFSMQMKAGMFFLCAMLTSSGYLFGQNDIQLSQQMFNRGNYNPAASGLSEDLNFFLLARQQWIGFRNAPQTIVINGTTFVPWTQSGWGFTIAGDMLGFEKSLNPKIRYAFHIPFMQTRSSLALGIGAGVMHKTQNFNEATYENPADPERQYGTQSQTRPDIDFGVEYNARYISAGASVTHLGNKINNNLTTESAPHYYLYARGMFDLNRNWQLTPSLAWHNTKNLNQVEVNATVFMKKRFWAGASYRLQESVVILAGVYITSTVMLGYSYDYSTVSLHNYETGSHEIMLSVRIPQPQKTRRAARMRECYHGWW
ncbi:MAG: PorP/SprF family type IX secretion system membrane protein [Bacteroidales bacterium]|jgi:type IX secretion system PorP/SprF family membrane protein|nr:PorP/SprF family type IX secretion system membrane protein [Bacteroidales bacterium]